MRRWAAIICSGLFLATAACSIAGTAEVVSEGNLLDRVVRWSDGSTEHVQIAEDGSFRLNGVDKKLVGIDIGTTGFTGHFYEPTNLGTIDKELTYLELIGVRVVQANFYYVGNGKELERYSGLLDLFEKHRMLVVPIITAKWLPDFNIMAGPDFRIENSDSMGSWAKRWCDVMNGYPNVIAVCAENELDLRLSGQTYTHTEAGAYVEFLTGIIRENMNIPVLTKVTAHFDRGIADAIKRAVQPHVDFMAFDLYRKTAAEIGNAVNVIKGWLGGQEGWWLGELNAGCGHEPDTSGFNSTFLDAAFDRGVSTAFLWVGNSVQQPAAAFFDTNTGGEYTVLLMRVPLAHDSLGPPVIRVSPWSF